MTHEHRAKLQAYRADYCIPFDDDSEWVIASNALIAGAEWEYNRTKWFRDRFPNSERRILIRLIGQPHIVNVGHFNDSEGIYIIDAGGAISNNGRIEWAEIPL